VIYENPPLPEDVNVSRDSVLGEFLRLLVALIAIVAIAGTMLYFLGGWLARFVPFSAEMSWTGDAVLGFDLQEARDGESTQRYLQSLADRLAAEMELPDGMRPSAHYAELDVPNAFATLGGHIVVTTALYRIMPSENALAFVVAHEIAHIEARDPIAALGGGALLGLGLTLLGRDAEALAPQVAYLVLNGYSRRAERRADAAALEAVRRLYGHAAGAAAAFEALGAHEGRAGRIPTFLSTHPATQERIAALSDAAADWDRTSQPLLPLAVSTRD